MRRPGRPGRSPGGFLRSLPAGLLFSVPLGPARAAFDPQGLAPIRPMLEAEVAAGRTNGMVTLVLHRGRVVHQEAVGWADRTMIA